MPSSALPLFETQTAKGRIIYRLFASSVFVGICMVWTYRLVHFPEQNGRWAWLGMLLSELWFGFYWILTQAHRWKPVFRTTFKDRLSYTFERDLPSVDVFVCTADVALEPPVMVINTVLSVLAYDYPPEKLSVYLSDDGGSALTFYALVEASKFAKHWLPYCNRFRIEARSPAAYFRTIVGDRPSDADFTRIKELYEAMETRIKTAVENDRVPEEMITEHEGFSCWNSFSSKKDHDTILQILVDGRSPSAKDVEGHSLPTLVYLAREKRPQYHHNNKAGAMNALIRVSGGISNGQIILNVDCDMYSNNSQSVRDALCFFMDEERGSEVGFVQFPQNFENITQNDIYGSSMRAVGQIEFQGLDSYGGPLYIGTGCFHRRDSLCGLNYTKSYKNEWKVKNYVPNHSDEGKAVLEKSLMHLASCTYESNTQWGKEMGLKYGCPVEDVLTGVAIQCRGWKSIFYNPSRAAFLGVAPMTLMQTLVQHKRWSEGDFQVFLSKHGPVRYGFGKLSLGLQMGYSVYCLWAPNCLATLYYSLVPPLALLNGTVLFPKVSSPWFKAFAYVIIAQNAYSFGEFLWGGGTAKGWWNEQRIWLYKRCTSYLLALIDTFLWLAGSTGSAFIITAKVSNQEVTKRYYEELIEFGASSQMFTILATLAFINLFSLVKTVAAVRDESYKMMSLEILLCGTSVLLNLPLYNGIFLRRDSGKMPLSVTLTSVAWASATCMLCSFM